MKLFALVREYKFPNERMALLVCISTNRKLVQEQYDNRRPECAYENECERECDDKTCDQRCDVYRIKEIEITEGMLIEFTPSTRISCFIKTT